MTAPAMDPATGLLPWQAWNVAHGPRWQARLDRGGRAHVIGQGLAGHATYAAGYADPRRLFAGGRPQAEEWAMFRIPLPRSMRPRPWHTFERACRAANLHNRMIVAAERQGVSE